MKVDKGFIKKVAEVARLQLTEKEEKQFVDDFKEILKIFSTLDEVKTDEEQSFHPVEMKDRLRDDIVEDSLSQEEALANTMHKKGGYFKGPRAI